MVVVSASAGPGRGGNHHTRSCAIAVVACGPARHRHVCPTLATDRGARKGRRGGEVGRGGGPSCSTSSGGHRAGGGQHPQARGAGTSPRGNGWSGDGDCDGGRGCGVVSCVVCERELGRMGRTAETRRRASDAWSECCLRDWQAQTRSRRKAERVDSILPHFGGGGGLPQTHKKTRSSHGAWARNTHAGRACITRWGAYLENDDHQYQQQLQQNVATMAPSCSRFVACGLWWGGVRGDETGLQQQQKQRSSI